MKTRLRHFLESRNGALFFLFMGLLPYLWFFLHPDKSPSWDWRYFNTQAMIAREMVLSGVFPSHDPWVCGGVDVLANPQSWIFSPSMLITLLYPAYYGNLLSLIIYGMVGFRGMYQLLGQSNRYKKAVISALFILSSFFYLHFTEGHIAYRTFYLLPWVLYFSTRASIKNYIGLTVVLVTMLLDGGIYPLFFSLFLIAFNCNYKEYFSLLMKRTLYISLITFAAIMVAMPKILPVLAVHKSRAPQTEEINLTLSALFQSFFNINQSHLVQLESLQFRFHEFGFYIGLSLFILFCISLKDMKKNKWLMVQLFFFLWMGTGWGGWFNPWTIVKMTPFMKQMHVQSRILILFYLILLLLVSRSKTEGKFTKILMFTAMAEMIFCGFSITTKAFREFSKPGEYHLIPENEFTKYAVFSPLPEPYLYGIATHGCYEPANPWRLDDTLKIFPDSHDTKKLVIRGFDVTVESPLPIREKFALNMQWLAGWSCENCSVKNIRGIIEVTPPKEGTHVLKLKYDPPYFPGIIWSYVVGIILLSVITFRVRKNAEL